MKLIYIVLLTAFMSGCAFIELPECRDDEIYDSYTNECVATYRSRDEVFLMECWDDYDCPSEYYCSWREGLCKRRQ